MSNDLKAAVLRCASVEMHATKCSLVVAVSHALKLAGDLVYAELEQAAGCEAIGPWDANATPDERAAVMDAAITQCDARPVQS